MMTYVNVNYRDNYCDNRIIISLAHSYPASNIDTYAWTIAKRQVLKHFGCREVLTSLVMNQIFNMTKTTTPSRTKRASEIRDYEGDEKTKSDCPKTRACQTNLKGLMPDKPVLGVPLWQKNLLFVRLNSKILSRCPRPPDNTWKSRLFFSFFFSGFVLKNMRNFVTF